MGKKTPHLHFQRVLFAEEPAQRRRYGTVLVTRLIVRRRRRPEIRIAAVVYIDRAAEPAIDYRFPGRCMPENHL